MIKGRINFRFALIPAIINRKLLIYSDVVRRKRININILLTDLTYLYDHLDFKLSTF